MEDGLVSCLVLIELIDGDGRVEGDARTCYESAGVIVGDD